MPRKRHRCAAPIDCLHSVVHELCVSPNEVDGSILSTATVEQGEHETVDDAILLFLPFVLAALHVVAELGFRPASESGGQAFDWRKGVPIEGGLVRCENETEFRPAVLAFEAGKDGLAD